MDHTQLNFFRRILLVFAGVLIITSCSEEPLIEQPEEMKSESQTAVDTTLIEGHYIVVISKEPAVKSSKAAELLEQVTGEISKQPGSKINRKYTRALSGFSAELSEKQVSELQKDDRIMLLEKDRKVYLHSEPVAQFYPYWGLDRIDQRAGEFDRSYNYSSTGKGVTAYVIDTGMRISHEEFEGRASYGIDLVQEDGEEGEDCYNHGTPVAGIIGGKTYGVAKDINIVSIKVFTCQGGAPASRILEALDWVNENAEKPAIVNASFGYSATEAMDLAVENTINSEIHFAVSAGNSNEDACNYSPARVPGAVTAGASDFENNIADYTPYGGSNFGSCVDIFAPGKDNTTASSFNDTNWRYFSGTSAAAPYVTGVIALYLENNPDATPLEVQTAIKENATADAIAGVPSGTNNMVYSLWSPVGLVPSPPGLELTATATKVRGQNYADLTWNPTDAPFIKVYVNGATNSYVEHINDGEQQVRIGDKERDVTYKVKICEVLYGDCSEEIDVIFGNGGDSGGDDYQ
jgi:subtilisin family serine protease